tara:strand:+ start:74 stop:595 length:522 start_codon:yes stop_codon:yes gene_type:complete
MNNYGPQGIYNQLVLAEPSTSFAEKVPPNMEKINEMLQKEEDEEEIVVINEIELKDFKSKVKIWMGIDDEIKMLQEAIKERKQKKKELGDEVLQFMGVHNIENLNTKKGDKLKYSVSKRKKALSNKIVKERFNNVFEKNNNFDKYKEYIFGGQEEVESVNLRRLNKKINLDID